MIEMTKTTLKLLSTAAYDSTPGWKLDADGHIELRDGNPVFFNGAGQEMTVAQDTISKLNNEAKTHREAKESALASLKAFEGLDADVARKALKTVEGLDAKTLMESGKVDELKAQITTQFQEQLKEKDTAFNLLNDKFNSTQINAVFAGSEFVRNNIAVPLDMFQATFKDSFKVEEGKVVAYGKDGNRLLSKTQAGEYASADEALQLLVESHSQKDLILKANSGSGSGSDGGGGNRPAGVKVVTRAEFEKLAPNQQAEVSKKVGSGDMQLTD